MLIEEKALTHWIENFYGYGSWHAKMWFVSYEENGGENPEEVSEKLDYFYKAHEPHGEGILCDIREAYKGVSMWMEGPKAGLFNNRYEYRFGTHAIQNTVWRNLIAFEHGWRNETLPEVLPYQQRSFALPSARREALIRLYPLPSPHTHSWYYSWLDLPIRFLKSRAQYEQQVYQRRMHTIISNMTKYKPELLLMYGMNNINAIKSSIQGAFPAAKFRMIKAALTRSGGGRIPQHHRADLGATTVLITTQIPALRHHRIETGFDWEEFGRRVASQGTLNRRA